MGKKGNGSSYNASVHVENITYEQASLLEHEGRMLNHNNSTDKSRMSSYVGKVSGSINYVGGAKRIGNKK